jgi:hypothetical protein
MLAREEKNNDWTKGHHSSRADRRRGRAAPACRYLAAGELAAPAGTVVNADQEQERVVKLRGESQATCPSDFEPSEAVTEAGDDPGNRVSEDPDLLTFFE